MARLADGRLVGALREPRDEARVAGGLGVRAYSGAKRQEDSSYCSQWLEESTKRRTVHGVYCDAAATHFNHSHVVLVQREHVFEELHESHQFGRVPYGH